MNKYPFMRDGEQVFISAKVALFGHATLEEDENGDMFDEIVEIVGIHDNKLDIKRLSGEITWVYPNDIYSLEDIAENNNDEFAEELFAKHNLTR